MEQKPVTAVKRSATPAMAPRMPSVLFCERLTRLMEQASSAVPADGPNDPVRAAFVLAEHGAYLSSRAMRPLSELGPEDLVDDGARFRKPPVDDLPEDMAVLS